ncbi:unnamed protein product [Calicophoron daubneyi]|uniref:DIRP domain-containing protein n=1 Tax=Calicophoron daubneyi TaxID=300641 RepID=A0AAV2TIS3_CALDB
MADESYQPDFGYVPYECEEQTHPGLGLETSQSSGSIGFVPFVTTSNADSDHGTSDPASKFIRARSVQQRRFYHMLTTPKFCDWLKHEWLYSSTDREIFLGSNDFQLVLREHFPSLKTRKLTRGHWALIRRIIGRPRRFSATFLAEERGSVQGKRRNLHYLQHLILTGSLGPMASEHLDSLLNSLPVTTRIPPRLPAGTKVCVSLYVPVQGLFSGIIQDACPGDSHYAVWIEGLILSNDSTHTSSDTVAEQKVSDFRSFRIVPDEDVYPLPNQSLPQSVPLSAIQYHFKENLVETSEPTFSSEYRTNRSFSSSRLCDNTNLRPDYDNPPLSSSGGPLLSDTNCLNTECPLGPSGPEDMAVEGLLMPNTKPENVGVVGPSADERSSQHLDPKANSSLFISLAKLYKLMDQKRTSVETLKEMNNTAEAKLAENRDSLTVQFQHSYATLILHLDKLNQELKYHMDIVLMHIAALAQDQHMIPINCITDWRRRCEDEAQEMVSRVRMTQRGSMTDDCKLDLVAKLTSLLIHLCNLSDHRIIGQSLACIDDLLKDIRQCLHPNNLKCFELTVEHFIGQIVNAVTAALQSRMQASAYGPPPPPAYPSAEGLSCI